MTRWERSTYCHSKSMRAKLLQDQIECHQYERQDCAGISTRTSREVGQPKQLIQKLCTCQEWQKQPTIKSRRRMSSSLFFLPWSNRSFPGNHMIRFSFFVGCRGPNSQFFGQISAQNLSKIRNVWVKVWTRHPKKRVFATNPDSRQKRVNAT